MCPRFGLEDVVPETEEVPVAKPLWVQHCTCSHILACQANKFGHFVEEVLIQDGWRGKFYNFSDILILQFVLLVGIVILLLAVWSEHPGWIYDHFFGQCWIRF
jgi:hypothetical protein